MSDQPTILQQPQPPPGVGGGLPTPGAYPTPPGQPVPVMIPPVPPVETIEVEARDKLGIHLAEAAMKLTQQAEMLSADEDPGKCKDMAQAALYLTEALVLVAPLESTAVGQAPAPLPPRHMPPQASLNTAEQQATGRTQ